MTTQFRNQQEIYREASVQGQEPSVSAALAHITFSQFAHDVTCEDIEIRRRYAEIFAQGDDEDDE